MPTHQQVLTRITLQGPASAGRPSQVRYFTAGLISGAVLSLILAVVGRPSGLDRLFELVGSRCSNTDVSQGHAPNTGLAASASLADGEPRQPGE
jgi:hypothetical protein